MEKDHLKILNKQLGEFFRKALRVMMKNPGAAFFILKAIIYQAFARKRRMKLSGDEFHVPPFMIISVTYGCNLKCLGCYVREQKRKFFKSAEMNDEILSKILEEAVELGISIILIAGGEPFLRKNLLNLLSGFPKAVFPIFTNGLLINSSIINTFKKHRNIIPVISIEGSDKYTDRRRGEGIQMKLDKIISDLAAEGILFGLSVTVDRNNFDAVMDGVFIDGFIRSGCKLFFFIDYVPVGKNTENLIVSKKQRMQMKERMDLFRRKSPALFVSFPGGEEEYGGCLAAGRGFFHVNANASVEPCPFSPFSDTSLKKVSLRQALGSDLLKKIRDDRAKLKETTGGCALWENRKWVGSLLRDKNSKF